MIMLFYVYGIGYTIKSRHHIKLEVIMQIVNLMIVFKSAITGRLDIELKVLEISIIGKLTTEYDPILIKRYVLMLQKYHNF